MIRRLAACAAAVTFIVSGCNSAEQADASDTKAEQTSSQPPATAQPAPAQAQQPDPAATAEVIDPAAPGAPDFAVLYPGAETDAPATIANGQSGPGGVVTFQTSAAPDEIVNFYREKAEAAGLKTVMGLNQGDARAYGAADNSTDGASLQVVAAPGEGGQTAVQLSWSTGS